MWASKATYLTTVGGVYAKLTDQPVDAIVVRFFGFFFLAWQTAELWGNLISSLGKKNEIKTQRKYSKNENAENINAFVEKNISCFLLNLVTCCS